MHRRLHHGALGYPHRRVRFVLWLALIAVAYYGAAKLGMSLSVSRGVITPVWAPSGIARVAPDPGGSLLARGDDRCVHRQRHERRCAGDRGGHLRRQHPGGGRGRCPRTEDRLHAGTRPGSIGSRASCGRGREHRGQRDQRHDRARARGRAAGFLRLRMAAVVVWRCHGDPRRRPDHARPLRRVQARSPHEAASRRGRRTPHRRGRHERDRLPRGSLALSLSDFPAAPLGGAPLPATRNRDLCLPGRGDRHLGAVDGSVPLGGETATERVQLAQASYAVVVVSLLVLGATLAEREAASRALAHGLAAGGGSGSRPHRELGVGHPPRPRRMVGRALPDLRARSGASRAPHLRHVPRARPSRRPGARRQDGENRAGRRAAVCDRAPDHPPRRPRAHPRQPGARSLSRGRAGQDDGDGTGRDRAASGRAAPRGHPLGRLARAADAADLGARLRAHAREAREHHEPGDDGRDRRGSCPGRPPA